MQNRTQQWDR